MDGRELRHFEAAWDRFADPELGHTVEDLLANAMSDDPEIALGGIGLLRRWLTEQERQMVPLALAKPVSWFDLARWLGRTEESVREEYGATA